MEKEGSGKLDEDDMEGRDRMRKRRKHTHTKGTTTDHAGLHSLSQPREASRAPLLRRRRGGPWWLIQFQCRYEAHAHHPPPAVKTWMQG